MILKSGGKVLHDLPMTRRFPWERASDGSCQTVSTGTHPDPYQSAASCSSRLLGKTLGADIRSNYAATRFG